jgi:hypothetical protein
MKKKFVIFIGSEQKGLLCAIADILEKKYNFSVIIIARDPSVKKHIDKLLSRRENDIVLSDIKPIVSNDNLLDEACDIEKRYNINLAMLMSEDRALGQGYFSNIEKIPDIIRASWPHEKKILELIKKIKKYEIALKGAEYFIRVWPDKCATAVLNANGGRSFSLTSIKYGDRFFWSDDNFITSKKYIDRIRKNISLKKCTNTNTSYQIDYDGEKVNLDARYTISNAIKIFFKIFYNDTKNLIRGMRKKDSYHYLGWAPSLFRSIANYRYVKSNSVFPSDINKNYRVCFFTLHMEPEVALLNFSPEFNNSFEAISWISKSLPVNAMLVIKEQANSFGVRSKWYYKQLKKIPNVMLADPEIHSWKWIDRADIVATITGTIGIESVYFNKPVISFGRHQVINYLPTVRYVSNFAETRDAVTELLSDNISEEDFHKSRSALTKAQLDSSFDLPEYKNSYDSSQIETKMAKIALENMFSEHPYLYKKQVNE